MYRSSRSVTRTVASSRLFHSSPLCLNTIRPRPTSAKQAEPSERKDDVRPDGQPVLPGRLQEAASLLRGHITKATVVTSTSIRRHADGFTSATQVLFSGISRQLNRATGHGDIELLKRKVEEQESRINAAHEAAQTAKQTYEEAVNRRSNPPQEVNQLLQHKHTRIEPDSGKFTEPVREDHSHEQGRAQEKEAAKATDGEGEQELNVLLRSFLARYHKEQVRSDKIQRRLMHGLMAALALNLLVFITATLVVEPWKRRRLTQTFEKKVEELTEETRDKLEKDIVQLQIRLDTVIATIPPPKAEVGSGKLVLSTLVLAWLLGRYW